MFEPADRPAKQLGLRLIVPDRPGYGLSDPMPGRRLHHWSSDVTHLLDHLGIEKASILAISGGGPYGIASAVQLGHRISGLALVSPLGEVGSPSAQAMMARAQRAFFAKLPRHPSLLRWCAASGRAAFLAAPHLFYGLFRATLSETDRAVLSIPDARHTVLDMTREALRQGIEGALSDMAIYGRPWGADPGAIACPAVMWQGTGDVIVPADVAFDLGRRIPGCVVHRLEGQGHFWVFAHVGEVLREVAAMASE